MKLKLIQTKQVYSSYRPDTACFIGFIPRGIARLEDIHFKFQPWFRREKDNNCILLRGIARHSWPKFLILTAFFFFLTQAPYRQCFWNSTNDLAQLHLLLQKWVWNDHGRCLVACHLNPSGWMLRCGQGPTAKAHAAEWGEQEGPGVSGDMKLSVLGDAKSTSSPILSSYH